MAEDWIAPLLLFARKPPFRRDPCSFQGLLSHRLLGERSEHIQAEFKAAQERIQLPCHFHMEEGGGTVSGSVDTYGDKESGNQTDSMESEGKERKLVLFFTMAIWACACHTHTHTHICTCLRFQFQGKGEQATKRDTADQYPHNSYFILHIFSIWTGVFVRRM